MVLGAALPVLSLCLAPAVLQQQQQQHVVFVVCDDLGFNDVGFHGSEIETPFLDSLALGPHTALLENYYGQSICTPARAAMLTGRFASHTGMQHSFWGQGQPGGLPYQFRTMADHFREAGYGACHRSLLRTMPSVRRPRGRCSRPDHHYAPSCTYLPPCPAPSRQTRR